MIRLALEHAGHFVETASDGPEGLQKFGNGDSFDLVLLDQRMPGMAGIDVLREIFKRKSGARMILITAFGTIDLALEAIREGASDFLRKPFAAQTLRSAVDTALAKTVSQMAAVPVGMACREFCRTNINGFSFEQEHEAEDERTGDLVFTYNLSRSNEPGHRLNVYLPAYVRELVRAYADTEQVPGGIRFWQAMSEEALANYLWQNAEVPESGQLRIEDLSSSLQNWLDSVLTIPLAD